MSKIVYVEIAGTNYPMRFSISAAKAISERFGSLDKMGDILGDGVTSSALDSILWIVELLIKQGCAYANLFEKNMVVPDRAPVKNGKWEPIDAETLAIALDVKDIATLTEKIYQTIGVGQEQTVEAEPKEKN